MPREPEKHALVARRLAGHDERPDKRDHAVERPEREPAEAAAKRGEVPADELRRLARDGRDDSEVDSTLGVPRDLYHLADPGCAQHPRDRICGRRCADNAHAGSPKPLRDARRPDPVRGGDARGRCVGGCRRRALHEHPARGEQLESLLDRAPRPELCRDLVDAVSAVEEREQRGEKGLHRAALHDDHRSSVLEQEPAVVTHQPIPGRKQRIARNPRHMRLECQSPPRELQQQLELQHETSIANAEAFRPFTSTVSSSKSSVK